MTTKKSVLIISYYWPPAGGPGVQRWLKFAKYLPSFNWKPIIYTPENPNYPIIDNSLLDEIPKNIKILKTRIWEPYQLAEKLSKNNKKFKGGQFDIGKNQNWKSKLSIWIRGNFFIPDARVFWVKPSVKFLEKYIQQNHIQTIITTGPPHSMHLIGLKLKQKFPSLKWIADFRDPWTEISYYKHLKLTRWADKKHRNLEKKVLQNADFTLATSYTDTENFKNLGAISVCITNGFDDIPEIKNIDNQYFTISYIGVLEQLRNPEILWEGLAELISENIDFGKDFRLRFVGRIDDKILSEINKTNLKNNFEYIGYLPHKDAFIEMYNAHILLITNFPKENARGIIPGKIFEYLATGNRILSFGIDNSDVEQILRITKAGKHFDYQSKKEVKDYILTNYINWKNNNLQKNTESINDFSRKNLTKKLVEILEK